mgnify:CR=1 FL=1
MDSDRTVRFHCSRRAARSARKATHDLRDRCDAVKAVLSTNPAYGVPVAGHARLRKMRVQVPKARLGKRGGYRCIYRTARIDEIDYVVFLEVYAKNVVADLSDQAYRTLEAEAEDILRDPLEVDWEDPPRPG